MQRAVCAPAYLSMRNTESSPPRCADWHWRHLDAVSSVGPGQAAQLSLVLQGHTVIDGPPEQRRLPQLGQRRLGLREGIFFAVLPPFALEQCLRTAGCGPACPVVWEGAPGNGRSLPD